MLKNEEVPIFLFDSEEAPEHSWVEIIIGDENAARDALAEHLEDENGNFPYRPIGPAKRTWLRPITPSLAVEEAQEWIHCTKGDPDGREFWCISTY